MKEHKLKLQKIVQSYLEHNGLSISFLSRKIGVNFASLFRFLHGQQNLSEDDIKKIWKFLEGKFLIPTEYIVAKLAAEFNCSEDELQLQDVLKLYLEMNDLSVSYAARVMKVSTTSLIRWINGERDLSRKYIYKINEFLKGEFLIDVRLIIIHIMIHEGEMDGAE